LLAAFDAVIKRCPEARLVIAGTDHPKTPGYLQALEQRSAHRKEISFIGYVAEEKIADLLQRSSIAVLPYTSSAGSSGIAHLACTYGVPMVASDIPDFRRLADEEGISIDFFPASDVGALAKHLTDLLGNKERQVEMALQNVSAALRMSMPGIIRAYLRTFELRQGIEAMRSIVRLRRLPRWFPLRETLVRRKARTLMRSMLHETAPSPAVLANPESAEVVYMTTTARAEVPVGKTGTEGM
jgi:glycosyltransferase involved in cell wall biosynthesis